MRWLVVGPMREFGGSSFEPSEYGVSAWYETEAGTRAEALRLALHNDTSVRDLADEARGDKRHPYTYLRAVPFPRSSTEECPDCGDAEELCPACSLGERNATRAIEALTQRYNADNSLDRQTVEDG